MITVRLMGGLGNQMFQYAAGHALARRLGTGLRLDMTLHAGAQVPVLVTGLQIPEPVAAGPTAMTKFLRRVLRRLRIPEAGVYREPNFYYATEFEGLRDGLTLDGYFQSWRYFEPVAADLRARFQPREELSSQAEALAETIRAHPRAVSVHVRRGDYLTAEALQVHGTLGLDYYRNAVKLMQAQLGEDGLFVIFSDDPEWARSQLQLGVQAIVAAGDTKRPWEDMQLMSRCGHHIVANSSFSWWGAWLNAAPDKLVIAPRQWFTSEALRERNICDLCPPQWVLL